MSSVSQRTKDERAAHDGERRKQDSDEPRRRGPATNPMPVLRQAMQQIAELTGRSADTVSAVERTEDGWRVELELVELERIPATTNILATYEVELDEQGGVVGFRRLRRYFRNAAEEG